MAPDNLLTEWCSLLFASFADAGITDVVISPGSRSTPLVAAIVRERRLRATTIIDERAASFFALGHARATGRPAPLVCTSGSAAAHYFPAVIEAGASGVPLVMVTADRPIELQQCGAPQTIDQTKLFGEHVRGFFDVGMPEASTRALAALRRVAFQAITRARYPRAGAVHVNVRARKPLEPALAGSGPTAELVAAASRVRARTPVVGLPSGAPDPEVIREVAGACDRAERGLLVCGPAPLRFARVRAAFFELARRTGFPVLAEATSQMRLGPRPEGVVVCDGFDAVLRSKTFRAARRPDLILQIGATPTSSAFEPYVEASQDARLIVIADDAWVDPSGKATHVVLGDATAVIASLAEAVASRRSVERESWSAAFASAGLVVRDVVESLTRRGQALTEGAAVRAVLASLPSGSTLSLGNSLPIRTADAFGGAAPSVNVLSQRGANGIDGLVAGASGSARALGGPFTLLVGDVTLLHDLSSLAIAKDVEGPFVIVVVQNFGGRIFEQLPLGRGPASGDDELRALYASTLAHACTPHAFDLTHAARFFGIEHARATTLEALEDALGRAYARRGTTLLEVIVAPSGAAEEYGRLWQEVDAQLSTPRS
jgi:2-succinyl-5-enolpyruvyl-6-hydroxy-3-cyclohexene-1-carboxylate synthase